MFFFKKNPRKPVGNRKVSITDSICDEYILQYNNPGQNGECELNIGLDFGTSSSKMVIQAPDLPGQPSYAINFGEYSSEVSPYLQPTILWLSADGVCYLDHHDNTKKIRNIKLKLFLDNDECNGGSASVSQNDNIEALAACYLALVLRYSRRWFLETKQDLLCHFERFIWNFNMGVPSPCIEDNEENRIFRRVGKVAWKLSTLKESQITITQAGIELSQVNDPEYWDNDEDFSCDFEIIPEVAAGAIGYALSDLRQNGLHIMIDIGASTLDVCSFKLDKKEGSNRYSLFLSDVQYLGTIGLYDSLINEPRNVYEKHAITLSATHDPMTPIPKEANHYLLPKEEIVAALKEVQESYKKEFLTTIRRVINQTRLRRDPNATVWRNGRLPVILIGGGCKMEFLYKAVEELDDWLKGLVRNDGIRFLSPPIPEQLVDSEEYADDYHYLAVSWGLSHRPLDVGDIIPADHIPDVERPRPINWRSRYVGKELV
ncbi:MAG: hypothetical protein SVV67_05540 [Bacillota bacterium]|nr:hypothetical protein [Bacillota bacterium]